MIYMSILCYTAKNRRRKRAKGFTLGTHFQLRAFKARRGNILRINITPKSQTTTLGLYIVLNCLRDYRQIYDYSISYAVGVGVHGCPFHSIIPLKFSIQKP